MLLQSSVRIVGVLIMLATAPLGDLILTWGFGGPVVFSGTALTQAQADAFSTALAGMSQISPFAGSAAADIAADIASGQLTIGDSPSDLPAGSDGNTILIDFDAPELDLSGIGDPSSPGMAILMVRFLHEYYHVKNGDFGRLSPCEHAMAWHETLSFWAAIGCETFIVANCDTITIALAKFDDKVTDCLAAGGSPPSTPAICICQ